MTSKGRASLYLAPALLILGLTVLVPVILTFRYSLLKYSLTDPGNISFVGLSNYRKVITDPGFQRALVNSGAILVGTVIIGMVLSLLFALVLEKKTKITSLLMAATIIPWALPPLVNGLIWKFIFFPGSGPINEMLIRIGLLDAPISWTTDRPLFLLVMSVVLSWRVVPFCSLVFLGNLGQIPEMLYEAMTLDGAGGIRRFRRITLPLLKPSFAIVFFQLTTAAANVYDEVIAMAGYQNSTQTLLVYNYQQTFGFLNFGLGSAMSYTIMVITGIFGIFYIRTMAGEMGGQR